MNSLIYKGYEIRSTPQQLKESKKWAIKISITKHKGSESIEKGFSSSNEFERIEDAKLHGLHFGKQIVDGLIDNCSIEDL